MNPKWEEQILVVSREKLFDNERLSFNGNIGSSNQYEKALSVTKNLEAYYTTMRRGDKNDPTPADNNAEINVEFKQPIPYAIIRKGDKIFLYERLKGGGESRLHSKLSIGVGGHMNDLPEEEKELIGNDYNFNTLLYDNLAREIDEELFLSSNDRDIEIIGLINDDTEEVSKVHIGILVVIDIDKDCEVEVNEPEQLEGRWATVTELLKPEIFDRLESWSQIAVHTLEG